MADSSPPRSRPASATSNRSRHRLSARSRRSHSLSPAFNRRSTSRGRESRISQQESSTPSRTSSPQAAPAIQSNPPKRDPFPQPFFGLQQERPVHVGNFDFEQKYPQDVRYHEQGPNARVYRVYQDEAEIFDADMVGEARDSLDVLLVFAGLFSAVLTTFVAQTSQSLSTDFAAISTSVLTEIALVLRAQTNGSSLDSIPTAIPTSSPSGLDVWVNGLWFVSLTLSLGAALLAVLVKQWLRQYMSMISGTVRDRSHIRQYRYDGLQKWHVLTFVAVMPFILHVAVGLFLIGLVLYLIPLRPVIAGLVGVITSVIYGTYIVTNVLPLLCTQCPYRTPFSDVLNIIRHALHSLFNPKSPAPFVSLREAERITVTAEANVEDAGVRAMEWLMAITSNPPTKSIVLQSLCAFSPAMMARLRVSGFHIPDDMVLECLTAKNQMCLRMINPGSEGKVERLLRSRLHFSPPPLSFVGPRYRITGVTDPALQAVMSVSKFLPIIDNSSDPFARWTALSFLEERILGWSDINNGIPALPRLVWDALVQTAIHESNANFERSFNSATGLRLCELICPTLSQPVNIAMKCLNLLPTGYALDDILIHVLCPSCKYPTAHRLAVMLVMSDYLSALDNPSDSNLEMMKTIWWSLGGEPQRMESYHVEHRLLVRRKAEELLHGSSRFNPSRWVAMSDPGLLADCWKAILGAYRLLSVSHAVFLREPFTLSTTLRSATRICSTVSDKWRAFDLTFTVEKLWIFTLNYNHAAGFDTFLEDDFLGIFLQRRQHRTLVIERVASFISGVTYQHDSDHYIKYLMQPEHLLGVCWILAEGELGRSLNFDDCATPPLEHIVHLLILLSPQNSSWTYIRMLLRNHLEQYPFDRFISQKAMIPPPIQLPSLPLPDPEFDNPLSFQVTQRINFLRNLERVQKVIEDYFTLPVLDNPGPSRCTVLQRLRMILPHFVSLDRTTPAIHSTSQV